MATQFARLISVEGDKATDRRRQGRRKASRSAKIESAKGTSAKVELADISEHGCAIVGGTDGMRAGGFVSIALGAGKPVQAIVRWVRDGRAGLEFLWPVPPEMTEWHDLMY